MPTPATRQDRPAGRPRIPAALAFQPGHSIGKNTLALSRRSATAASSPSGPIPRRIRASGSPRLLSGSNGSAEKRCRREREPWSVISLLGFTGHYSLVRAGSPDPAVRLIAGLHVTRRRSGTGTPAVAEDGGSGDHCPNQLPHEFQGLVLCFRTLLSATASSRGVGEPDTGAEVVQDQLFTGSGRACG